MSAQALLLVPPFLKTLSQPLLGPAMLAGAGRAAGHQVHVLDLNQRFIAAALPRDIPVVPRPFVGDHDRPSDLLRPIQRAFSAICRRHLPQTAPSGLAEDAALTLTYRHAEVQAAARSLAASYWGRWARSQLLEAEQRPDLVGVSVFYSGQVLFGLALSLLAKALWPGVPVVWGGPHVTALEEEIAKDPAYGGCIDRFVFGYAERSWVQILDAVETGAPWPVEAIRAGDNRSLRAKDDPEVVPFFSGLEGYRWGRLALPAQASRGCAYGRCRYCTYPAVEGRYRTLPMRPVQAVIEQALLMGAGVAFKDSLMVPQQLEAIANLIDGRVVWGACTKLHRRLDGPFLHRLARAGCQTLEVGLETLTEQGQLLVDKRQALPLFLGFLDAAEEAGIPVVVNYITGLPGSEPEEEQRWFRRLRQELASRPRLVSKIEHNSFQLERRSPLGQRPAAGGMAITGSWPWATVLAWEDVELERSLSARQGVLALSA